MKSAQRLISGLLSLVLVCSLCLTALPATADAAPTGTALTGSIGLTIRFDLPQTAAGAAARNIRLQVSSGGQTTVIPLPQGMDGENALDADISVSVKNTDDAVLINESRVGYYEVVLSGLPAGGTQYDLALTGDGYKTFSRTVTLDSYSQHMIVGTGDGTFSLGDVNGDGVVDDGDLAVVHIGDLTGVFDDGCHVGGNVIAAFPVAQYQGAVFPGGDEGVGIVGADDAEGVGAFNAPQAPAHGFQHVPALLGVKLQEVGRDFRVRLGGEGHPLPGELFL